MKWRGESIRRLAEQWILPLYVGIAILVGGASREGILQNGILQVAGATILIWCALDRQFPGPAPKARWLQFAAALFLTYGLVQLVPLPHWIWTHLGGREIVIDGFVRAGQADLPSMPLTIIPQNTVDALLRFLPPMAAFVLAYKTASGRGSRRTIYVIMFLAGISAMVGWVQVFGGRESPFYFWQISNRGSPVGLMANANHQATLLICALPFFVAHLSRLKLQAGRGDGYAGQIVLTSAGLLVSVIGIIMAGSLAGYILLGPVAALTFLMVLGRRASLRDGLIGVVAMVGVAVVGWWLSFSPVLPALGVTNLSDTELGRQNIWRLSVRAAGDFFPFGSGLGTFESLIPIYEDPAKVTGTFINHAHNDYIELLVEYGLVGGLVIAIALTTYFRLSYAAWKDRIGSSKKNLAASIAIGAVLLHSLVDYPVRTETIAVIVAFSMGLLASGTPRRSLRGVKRKVRSRTISA